jgi:hypothetical protein
VCYPQSKLGRHRQTPLNRNFDRISEVLTCA